jgi:hypothetical protein
MIYRHDEFYHLFWLDEYSDYTPFVVHTFGKNPRQRCQVVKFAHGMVFFVPVWFIDQCWQKSNVIFYFQAKKSSRYVYEWIVK